LYRYAVERWALRQFDGKGWFPKWFTDEYYRIITLVGGASRVVGFRVEGSGFRV
jgi:hypothetical protein